MSNTKRSNPSRTQGTDKKIRTEQQKEEEEGSTGRKTEDSFPNVVELNVGGKVITTKLSTLKKEPASELAAMFTGQKEVEKDKDGRYVLDLDVEVFQHVLNFLRLETLPQTEMALSVYDLANSLSIGKLASKLENYRTVKYRDQIERLRESNKEKFERFRKDVIDKLISADPSRPEKSLLIVNEQCNHCNCACYDRKIGLEINEDLSTEVYIRCYEYTGNNLKAILRYDLCEMGYAKYIEHVLIVKKNAIVVNSCSFRIKGHY